MSKLTALFPSTTSAHVACLHAGQLPAESGIYEWYQYEPAVGEMIAPLLSSRAGEKGRNGLDLGARDVVRRGNPPRAPRRARSALVLRDAGRVHALAVQRRVHPGDDGRSVQGAPRKGSTRSLAWSGRPAEASRG